jgi:hypothetical protein
MTKFPEPVETDNFDQVDVALRAYDPISVWDLRVNNRDISVFLYYIPNKNFPVYGRAYFNDDGTGNEIALIACPHRSKTLYNTLQHEIGHIVTGTVRHLPNGDSLP